MDSAKEAFGECLNLNERGFSLETHLALSVGAFAASCDALARTAKEQTVVATVH